MFRKRLELESEFQKLFKTISKREILKNQEIRRRLWNLKGKVLYLTVFRPATQPLEQVVN